MSNSIYLPYISAFFLVILLFPGRSIACDCIMHPIEKYIDTSEYIILAKVKKIISQNGSDYSGSRAILSVTKIYKGGQKKEELIEFDSDESDCAFRFKSKRKYLLFGYSRNGKFYVYNCSFSDEVKYSRENIGKIKKYLRSK